MDVILNDALKGLFEFHFVTENGRAVTHVHNRVLQTWNCTYV